MRWFHDLRISAKLLTGFSIVTLLAAVVGAVGISQIREINNADTHLYENNTLPIGQLGAARTALQRVRYNLLNITVSKDTATIKHDMGTIVTQSKLIDSLLPPVPTRTACRLGHDPRASRQLQVRIRAADVLRPLTSRLRG